MIAFKALLIFAPFAAAKVLFRDAQGRCGSVPTAQEMIDAELRFAAKRPSAAPVGTVSGPIPIFWHVISGGTTPVLGNTPAQQIDNTVAVLNNAYGSFGIRFSLSNVTRTLNPLWFNSAAKGNALQTAMKASLRVGNAATLNIYTLGLSQGATLGYSPYPSGYDANPVNDGVVIRHTTLAGGSHPVYNLGMTVVHEVGHWLGLYHPFDGGCTGVGDLVADTPPAARELYGCQLGADTCPGSPGTDPVTNYMSYSDDACLNTFTPGQIIRIKEQIRLFRGINL